MKFGSRLHLLVSFLSLGCAMRAHSLDGGSMTNQSVSEAPKTKKEAKIFSEFGAERVDFYYWLRDVKNSEVLDYLRSENKYTDFVMSKTETIQADLFEEMKARIKESDSTEPAKLGKYLYYSRTEEGKPYRIYCRKKDVESAQEEILLDGNELSVGKSFFSLGAYAISPDQNFLAYAADFTGAESFEVFVKDLKTGKTRPESLIGVSYGLEWSNDNRSLYYLTRDKAERPFQLLRHSVGGDARQDELLFEEKDEAFHLGLGKTLDEEFIIVTSESATTSEVHLVDAKSPIAPARVFAPRKPGIEYSLDHSGDFFYVRTNEDAKNFKVMRVPNANWQKSEWKEFIPERQSRALSEIACFENWLVISKREDGLKKLTIVDLRTMGMHDVSFPEPSYDISDGSNLEFRTPYFRLVYSSLVTPKTVYDYDMENRRLIPRKVDEVLGGYKREDYQTDRVWVTAADGVKIPVSIVYKKDFPKNGSRPFLLEGYGAYGISNDVDFSSSRLSLLNRGFAFGIAHIRGGGEFGDVWHDAGKMQHKMTTFTDFISVAEWLIEARYTSKEKLSIIGGSAGGLLMGAVMNMRPDLFQTVLAIVPFVDQLNTMSDSSLPLTVGEYEEWGNPTKKDEYLWMRAYSPYDNIEKKDYPNILALASLNDTRVSYWEAAKWVAKLREFNTGNREILLRVNMEAGHAGSADRYKKLHETALTYAFLFKTLSIVP